jgi:predicted Fe-S protein YdhL (DUF1289 family)
VIAPSIAFPCPARNLPGESTTAMTTIETPCTKVCVVDPRSGFCVGCGRNLSEIAQWAALSAEERRRVMARLPQRLAAFAGRADVADPARGDAS